MRVLWFSGGKDSMACLLLMREWLNDIHVLFANTGKYYPEHLATVAMAKALCPHWHEVTSDRDGQWRANGFPSDLVPMDWTVQGQTMTTLKPFTVQSYMQCCWENIGAPLWGETKRLGASVVIRGQRADEAHHSTARNGYTEDGVTFIHPIEHWTKQEVLAYLTEQMGELPRHYALDHSSMDCYDCTAYAAHSLDRVAFMKKQHPALYADYSGKRALLMSAIRQPLQHYEALDA